MPAATPRTAGIRGSLKVGGVGRLGKISVKRRLKPSCKLKLAPPLSLIHCGREYSTGIAFNYGRGGACGCAA